MLGEKKMLIKTEKNEGLSLNLKVKVIISLGNASPTIKS